MAIDKNQSVKSLFLVLIEWIRINTVAADTNPIWIRIMTSVLGSDILVQHPAMTCFPPPLSLCSAILLYAILTICFKVDHSGDGGGGGEVHGITGRRQSGDTVTFIPAGYYYSQLQFLYPLVPGIDPHKHWQCCESGSS